VNLRKLPVLIASRVARAMSEAGERRFWRLVELFRPIPVYRLDGETHAGTAGRMIVAGFSPFVDYLPERFFAKPPERTQLRNQTLMGLRDRMLMESEGADLVLTRADKLLASLIARRDFLQLPQSIACMLRVPPETSSLAASSHSLRVDLGLVRHRGFVMRRSEREEDVRLFYDSFYLPTVKHRHRNFAVPRSWSGVRSAARRGGLFWVEHQGEVVGGCVYCFRNGRIFAHSMGQRPAANGRPRPGVDAAIYYHLIETSRRLGFGEIDFGGCRPSLHDGVVRYKRKWGMAMIDNCGADHDLLLRWRQVTPAVESFIQHTSLIFRDGTEFAAVVAGAPEEWSDLTMPGVDAYFTIRVGTRFGELVPVKPGPRERSLDARSGAQPKFTSSGAQ